MSKVGINKINYIDAVSNCNVGVIPNAAAFNQSGFGKRICVGANCKAITFIKHSDLIGFGGIIVAISVIAAEYYTNTIAAGCSNCECVAVAFSRTCSSICGKYNRTFNNCGIACALCIECNFVAVSAEGNAIERELYSFIYGSCNFSCKICGNSGYLGTCINCQTAK